MPSPFPGMDPYLESPVHWADFHHRFIDDLSDAIAARLPQPYYAKIDEHVMIVDPEISADPRLVIPDLLVGRIPSSTAPRGGAAVAEVDPEPEILANIIHLDPLMQGFIEIRRLPDHELVTVIAVMSPANKNGGRGQYLDKRELLLRKPVGVVEVDLLRAGHRIQLNKPLPVGHYYALISRSDRRPSCEVHHWTVRDRLPRLPIPLRPGEAEIKIDLQEPFAAAFERGRYQRFIDYNESPPPPEFANNDADWVAQTARAGGQVR